MPSPCEKCRTSLTTHGSLKDSHLARLAALMPEFHAMDTGQKTAGMNKTPVTVWPRHRNKGQTSQQP